MNILHVNFDVSKFFPYWHGGVSSVIQNIIKYTQTQRSNHYLLTLDYRFKHYKKKRNTHIIPLDEKRRLGFLFNPFNLWNILKNIDIVHFHHSADLKIALYFKLLRPLVKMVETIYSKPVSGYSKKRSFIEKTIAVSKDIQQALIENNYPSDRIEIIPIIPDFDKYNIDEYRNKYRRENDKFKIWFSAGPRKEMGLFYLLDEIEELNRTKEIEEKFIFLISIYQPEFKETYKAVKKEIEEKKLKNVSMTPDFIKDVPEFMNSVDALIYPIINHSSKMSIPLMMLEAMLMEKLIITTPSGGIPEVVNEKNGILFRPKSDSLTRTLKYLITLSKPKLERIKQKARESIKNYEKKVAYRYQSFYHKLFNK